MNRPSSVRKVIRALASGDAVDWPASLASAEPDGASRSLLEALALVDRISHAQRTLSRDGQTGVPAPSPSARGWAPCACSRSSAAVPTASSIARWTSG